MVDRETGIVQEFACRVCNDCIATRKHQWLARAMAERASWPFALAVTLTYSNDEPANRDSAAMFCYDDVRGFLKRLLSAARFYAKSNKLGFVPRVRFICAGEQGSRTNRVHWHLILFSDLDLCLLGEVSRKAGVVNTREEMISGSRGRDEKRLHWSLWGKGFVLMQVPDQGAFAYVLKYCLKDSFTVEKSVGTMRHAKAEDFATGMFRMSKRPAIGQQWLEGQLARLYEAGAVLPALELRVPGMKMAWVPSGNSRKLVLWSMAAINRLTRYRTGADAPQWSSLLAATADSPYDRRILDGVFWSDQKAASAARSVTLSGRTAVRDRSEGWHVRRCGYVVRCRFCWGDAETQAQFRGEFHSEAFDRTAVRYTRDGEGVAETRQGEKVRHWVYKGSQPGVAGGGFFISERVGPFVKCEGCGGVHDLYAVAVSETVGWVGPQAFDAKQAGSAR